MAKYLEIIKTLLAQFQTIKIEQVGRDLNSQVYALTGLASVFEGENGRIITMDLISVPNNEINQKSILSNIELGPNWIDPIADFLH